ncbi:MAG: hypothetical protein ACRDSJ_19980 [Rubrobacteraceae bacterium]
MRWMCVVLTFSALVFLACGSEEPAGENGGGGSNGGQNGEQAEAGAGEEQYAQGQYNLTEDGAADDQYEDASPEDLPLPLPPDAEIIAAGARPDETYLAAMNVPSDREAYDFYLEAVPEAGYEILNQRNSEEGENTNGEGQNGGEQNGEEAFSGRIAVEGDGYRGSVRFGGGVAIIRLSRTLFEQAERYQQRQQEFQQRMEERREEQQEGAPEETQPPAEE